MTRPVTLILGASAFALSTPQLAEAADMVFRGGTVYTPQGFETAMAVENGVIVAFGDAAEAMSEGAEVVELDGATVLPGLHDSHVHAVSAGLKQTQCLIPQGSDMETLLDIVAECAADAAPGAWIQGGSYETSTLGARPTAAALDEVAPDNPVVLTDVSLHSRWANTAALDAAGIDADTQAPENGIIERGDDGAPTGVLHESATGLVESAIPAPSAEELETALALAQDQMLSHGITAIMEALADGPTMQAYATLAEAGEFKQRAITCITVRDPEAIEQRGSFAIDPVEPRCVKLFLDGVPTDSNTAAMLAPYEHGAYDGEPGTGMLMVPQDELNAQVAKFDAMGMMTKIHAAGDGAVRAAIRAIEYAREENGPVGPTHNIAHLSFVAPEDFERARAAGAVMEFSPYIFFDHPIVQGIRHAVGDARMERWIPVADAIDAGVLSVAGSDWPVVPFVNPWPAIETLVTRQAPGGSETETGASQKITVVQALDLFTRNAAQLHGRAHLTGTLELGKLADLAIIDRNIFEIDPTEIHDTTVIATYIGGEEVYAAD
ncbi:amidohydrolase [Palleronia sp.]|uniref:amidohydrolase n=1 Tax=Palleronia sp. TaxID=1940284 RepID=UPI0035C7A24C